MTHGPMGTVNSMVMLRRCMVSMWSSLFSSWTSVVWCKPPHPDFMNPPKSGEKTSCSWSLFIFFDLIISLFYMDGIKYEYIKGTNMIKYSDSSASLLGREHVSVTLRPGDPCEWTPDGIDPWFILPTSFWLLCSYKLCYVYKCLLHLLTSILYMDLYIIYPNMHIQG